MRILGQEVTFSQKLYTDKIRGFCVEHGLYTRGDIEAYSNMFKMCERYDGNIEDLVEIARDIYSHSDKEGYVDCGDTEGECVAYLTTDLYRLVQCQFDIED